MAAACALTLLAGCTGNQTAPVQEPEPFLANNSGHGMLFRTFEGELRFVVHHSEGNGGRKPQFWTVDDSGDKLALGHLIEL